jgi:hypothetical protein
MATKKGTMAKVGEGIKGAASTVAQAADDYVVQPVGKAVGLIDKKPAPPKSKSARKAGRKKAVAKAAARKK